MNRCAAAVRARRQFPLQFVQFREFSPRQCLPALRGRRVRAKSREKPTRFRKRWRARALPADPKSTGHTFRGRRSVAPSAAVLPARVSDGKPRPAGFPRSLSDGHASQCGGSDSRLLRRLPADNLRPIACNEKALFPEQRRQYTRIGDRATVAITDLRELDDRFAFHLEQNKTPLVTVAEWLDLWRRCCPIYEFRIDLHAAGGSVLFSVIGRPGVKEYIAIDSPKPAAKLRQ